MISRIDTGLWPIRGKIRLFQLDQFPEQILVVADDVIHLVFRVFDRKETVLVPPPSLTAADMKMVV